MASIRKLLGSVDQLLRGQFTRREELAAGRIEIPIGTLVQAGLLLGGLYGVCMGLFAVLRGGDGSYAQLLATMAKVPLLFLLTLTVTFPSLYVFSALSGSKLRAPESLRLMLIAIAVNLALLASLGPVTAFFTLSTDSYHFMVLLNVVFFAIAGFVGLSFLIRALEALFAFHAALPAPPPPASDAAPPQVRASIEECETAPPPPTTSTTRELPARKEFGTPERRARRIFFTWTIVFAIVGAQMGWILRPFIGHPGLPFTLFRERESNFFEAFFRNLGQLFS